MKILPYDGRAPEIFEEVKRFICGVVPFEVEVEHIGSTAVSGLGGKGIIDVLVVTRKELMEKVVDILVSRGFRFNPEGGTPPERLFVSGPFNFRGEELHIHIHVTFFGSGEHKDKLLFRDYLRRRPEEAKRYLELKKRWSRMAGQDGSKYTELKTQYVKEVLEKARKELGEQL